MAKKHLVTCPRCGRLGRPERSADGSRKTVRHTTYPIVCIISEKAKVAK